MTPERLRGADLPVEERDTLVTTWTDAVARCNEFLASPFRHSLPAGRIELDERRGMRFETGGRTWALGVECTTWGGMALSFGFQAQEDECGFLVGACPPDRDPAADNSLFRTSRGFAMEPDIVADLILHEATHVVHGEGAIGFWKSAGYYAEAIFLFRYGPTHSDERCAYGTGEEYHAFIQGVGRPQEAARQLEQLEKHIAAGPKKSCRHDGIVVAGLAGCVDTPSRAARPSARDVRANLGGSSHDAVRTQ